MFSQIRLVVFLCALWPYYLGAEDRPNIIFLFTDDQTFDSLGCYGNPEVQTPHIDGLSERGLTFDHYYNTTAICMASRANVMTGMYEYRNGCNFGMGDLPQKHFDTSYPVLLREAGYLTAIAGKIGFEVEGVGLPEDWFDWWGASPGQTNYATGSNKSIAKYAKDHPHSTLAYGAFGRDFIQWASVKDQPFCLSISFKAPHQPVEPDPQFDHVYKGITFSKPDNYGRESGLHFSKQSRTGRQFERFISWGYQEQYSGALRKYHQQIYAVDQAVGMLEEALKANGVNENTVIVFTSDNGFLNGAHGYGSKVLPYEEATRAPMIIHDPRNQASHGQRTAALSGNIDVAPTILDLAGVAAPDKMDGKSLMPLLNNPSLSMHDDLALMNYWGPKSCQSFAVLSARYKYIYWYFDDESMDPAEELYDLHKDRLEMVNLASAPASAEVLAMMRKIYDRQVARIGIEAERNSYKVYSNIFSRHLDWDVKKELLASKRAKRNKKASSSVGKPQ